LLKVWSKSAKYLSTYRVKEAITSKIKLAIKHKTSPARLAQLLQPPLAFCFSLQPMTAYRPVLAGLDLCFIASFILLVIAP